MAKSKSLPLAIGLNLLLPGVGYVYMGRWILGIAACALILAIFKSNAAQNALLVWLAMNALMAVDMVMLDNKNKKKIKDRETVKCGSCAELILAEAKICRYCQADVQ